MDLLEIEVTEEDIDLGEPGDSRQCAVARAACRAYKLPLGQVGVGWSTLNFDSGVFLVMPTNLAQKINDLDDRKPVAPFKFTPTSALK